MKPKLLKLLAAATALSLLVAGCVTLSVYPFYTPKDLIFDPALTGRWVETKDANSFWQFDRTDEKFYMLTVADNQTSNGFAANLFQLKQYRFLDLLTTNRNNFFMIPLHAIAKVGPNTGTNVSLHFLDYNWLTSLLQTNPAVLRHIVVPDQPGTTNSDAMLYLTADTKELQHFLLKHAEDTNAFDPESLVELQRVSH